MTERTLLPRRFDAAHIPSDGSEVTITASEAERSALTKAYELLALNSLTATATLTPAGKGSVEVRGRVMADIVQACVVSLEPVEQHIDETFDLHFVPADSPELSPPKPGKEIVIDPIGADPPEVMDGTGIQLGALIEEIFVLAIDPYPRAPGAVLPVDVTPADTAEESPFAVLKQISKTKG